MIVYKTLNTSSKVLNYNQRVKHSTRTKNKVKKLERKTITKYNITNDNKIFLESIGLKTR